MVANYAAFYSGNFIASLNALEVMFAERGVKVPMCFRRMRFSPTGEKLQTQKEEQRTYIRTHFGVESWCEEIMQVYGMR